MSLADYKPQWREVPAGGQSLRLRGLSLDDLSTLLRTAGIDSDVEKVFAIYNDSVQMGASVEATITAIVKEAPTVTAHMIALAAEEPECWEAAKQFPFPLSIRCALEIMDLTFHDIGGPKNFLGLLLNLVQGLGLNAAALPKPPTTPTGEPSTASTKESAKR